MLNYQWHKMKKKNKKENKRTTKHLYERLNYVGTNCVFNAYLTCFFGIVIVEQQHNDAKHYSLCQLNMNSFVTLTICICTNSINFIRISKWKKKKYIIGRCAHWCLIKRITCFDDKNSLFFVHFSRCIAFFLNGIDFLKINICSLHMLIWFPIFFFFSKSLSYFYTMFTQNSISLPCLPVNNNEQSNCYYSFTWKL